MNNKEFKTLVGNKIFSVRFTKKDGSIRNLNGRLGVTKYLSGVGLKYNPELLNMIPVFDLQIKEYRIVNLNTVDKIKCNKKVLEF
jgi:hypothetical protein